MRNCIANGAKCMAAVIIAISVAVCVGWIIDHETIKRVCDGWVSMKVPTAFCFALIGLMLFVMSDDMVRFSFRKELTVSFLSLMVLGVVGLETISALVPSLDLSIANVPAADIFTVKPGLPSLAGLFGLLVSSCAGLAFVFNTVRWRRRVMMCGATLMMIGGIAVVGYVLRVPALFYFVPCVSTGMAIHSAALMIMAGAAFVIISRSKADRSHPVICFKERNADCLAN